VQQSEAEATRVKYELARQRVSLAASNGAARSCCSRGVQLVALVLARACSRPGQAGGE